jgi:alpha-tubulin suppressor-like RCC1 family protein
MASGNTKDDDVSVIGFGSNYFHALGGTEEISLAIVPQDESDNEGVEENSVPARILSDPPWKDNANLQQVVCSATATFFLTRDGHVYQTGTLHGIVATCPTRVQVPFPRKCVQISAGRHFCIAKLEQGIGVVSWGAGHFGQLGLGNHVSSLQTPQMIPALLPHTTLSNNANNNSTRVQQVAAGAWHALALLDNGTCMAWGSNRKLLRNCSFPQKWGTAHPVHAPSGALFWQIFQNFRRTTALLGHRNRDGTRLRVGCQSFRTVRTVFAEK